MFSNILIAYTRAANHTVPKGSLILEQLDLVNILSGYIYQQSAVFIHEDYHSLLIVEGLRVGHHSEADIGQGRLHSRASDSLLDLIRSGQSFQQSRTMHSRSQLAIALLIVSKCRQVHFMRELTCLTIYKVNNTILGCSQQPSISLSLTNMN